MPSLWYPTALCVLWHSIASWAVELCPNGLQCPRRCCTGAGQPDRPAYFCCDEELERVYVVGLSHWWRDNSGVLLGCLIASIIISVILSLACCFFCNGCWWFKRRRQGAAFGGACMNSFPFGTIIYSPYPPTLNDCQAGHNGATATNVSRPRVHFEDDLSLSADSYDRLRPSLKPGKV
uniref:Vesicular, overexpressed in cancer, prosurvival protein 1 n=1 Tax=Trichuris muris TaxID=70415 RepID=A0A5S6R0T1_TRIMR